MLEVDSEKSDKPEHSNITWLLINTLEIIPKYSYKTKSHQKTERFTASCVRRFFTSIITPILGREEYRKDFENIIAEKGCTLPFVKFLSNHFSPEPTNLAIYPRLKSINL